MSVAFISLALFLTAASMPVAAHESSQSELLTVVRRHPAQYNNGHQPAIEMAKARYDCHSSAVKQGWSSLRRYAHVNFFRSDLDAFREYIPPPASEGGAQDTGRVPHVVAASRKPCAGAIIGMLVGLLALLFVSHFAFAALRRARRRRQEQQALPKFTDSKHRTSASFSDKFAFNHTEEASVPAYRDARS